MSSRDDPPGPFGKTYFQDGEPGIHPPFVMVKDSLGHFEKQASLSSRWILDFNWLDFLPEDNMRDQRLQYLNHDLVTLLRLKHYLFWSNVCLDTGFSKFLDSFLLYAKRLGTTRSLNMPTTEVLGAEASVDPALLSPSHKTLMRSVFSVVVRLATAKESTSCGFGSPQAHGDLVYGVLDLPRLFDFVSLFARYNFPLVSNLVDHLFSIQPKYDQGLLNAVNAANQVILEMSRKLSASLKLALAPTAPVAETNISAATSTAGSQNTIATMRLTCEDISTYYIDLVYGLSTFAKVYPDTAAHLARTDTVALLSYMLRASLPNLKLLFDESQPGALDSLRRHVASRNHTLSIVNKVFSHLIHDLLTAMDVTDEIETNSSKASPPAPVSEDRLVKIEEMVAVLIQQLQTLTLPDRQLVERVSKSKEDDKPLAWLLLEDELQQSYALKASTDESLKSSTGLSMTVINPEAMIIIRDLNTKYSLLAVLEKLRERLIAAAGENVEKLRASLTSFENMLSEIRVNLEQASSESDASSNPIINKQLELQWQDATRRSTFVSEIFPDLSSGFIVFALLKHYKNEHERMISDLLEQNMPPALDKVNRKLTTEEARNLVFGDKEQSAALKAAEAEENARFKIPTNATYANKKKGRVTLKEALHQGDAAELARMTVKLVERQDIAEQERSYMTQLKRSRGEHVDEDDEELHERLRASAELSQRAERGALTYEDEPDDSLDDFHPVGAGADDDNDSKLTNRRGPIRSSRTSNAHNNDFTARSKSRSYDDPDEEEDYEKNFAADDALLLPYTPSPQSFQPPRSQPKHQSHSQGGHQQQHKGQNQQKDRTQPSKQPKGPTSSSGNGNDQSQNQQRQGGRGRGAKKGGQPSNASSSSGSSMSSNAPSYTPSSSSQPSAPSSSGGGRGKPPQQGGRGKSQQGGRGK